MRQTTVKNFPRTASVAGGGETKIGELKENAGAMTRETNVKALPQPPSWRGARQKVENHTKWKGGPIPIR